MSRPRFRTRRTRVLVKTHTGKTFGLQPVGCISDQFPTRGIPMTSLRLARQVSTSHNHPPAPTGTWAMARGASTTTDARGGTIPHVMQVQQLAAMQAAHLDKSLNAGLTSCAAIPSPSSVTLPHASSTRGTQASPTTRTSLDLSSGVAG
jgi:hypothetical protein